MYGDLSVQQLFLRLRGGHLEVLLVLENIAGATYRETLRFPTRNTVDVIRQVAKQLAYRGTVTEVDNLRLRVETRGVLKDDVALKRLFISEFHHHCDGEMA
jgi:hypothetical protein